MSIIYRVLAPNESELYRNIRLESLKEFPESFSTSYEEALKMEKLILQFDIEKQTLNRFVYGAFNDKTLIGICAFINDEKNSGSIYQMYIQKEYHGLHIGLQLIKSLMEEVKDRFGNMAICLEVSTDNLPAIHLYKKVGFKTETGLDKKNVLKMKLRNE